ncbi:MAG: hypothetical protein AMXMBFR82_03150 [Candidatus Hydrogenedentota bacterium]
MNGAATHRRNGHAPSEATIAACRSLLGTAIKGDPDAAAELAAIPSQAWPDTLHRVVAGEIIKLTAGGGRLELSILLHRLAVGAEVSTGDVSELAAAEPTCNPWGLGDIIRTDYREREGRHLADLYLRGGITAPDLQAKLAELDTPAAAGKTSALSPVDTSEWLTGEPRPIEYLYHDMIARRSLILLTGQGGIGKSGVLLAIVTSGCIGRALLPAFRPASRLRVLWLCSEDDAEEVWRRWARLSDAYGLSDEDRAAFAENLRLYCNPGIPLMDAAGRTTDAYKWLHAEVDSFKPDLVCVDPLCHFHQFDENSNAEMAVFMSRLRDLSTPHCAAILAVHHVPKDREKEAKSAAARGASSIRDSARCMFGIVELNEKEVTDYGISNPRLFARLEHSKASWTPLSDRAVYLRNQDGVWFECDMAGQRDETLKDIQSRIARRIADEIAAEDHTYTRWEIYKGKPGEWLREKLSDEFGPNATRDKVRDAIKYGIGAGLLIEETETTKGKQRPTLRKPTDLRTGADNEPCPQVVTQ